MNHFHKIAEKLKDYQLDAMLITQEADRFYATGFHSTGTDGLALVTPKKNYYFTDSRYTEAAEKFVQGAELGQISRGRGYAVLLREVMEAEGIRTVGFEENYMTVKELEDYRKDLPCQLVPANQLLLSLRAVKDDEEIETMVAAQRIAERALEEIYNDLKPGVTEKEIAARLQYLMLHFGASDMSFDPIAASGPNSSMPHAVPTERALQAGDFVTMDFGCIYGGYCSDMTRTVAIGHVTDEMRTVYETVLKAQKAGIAAARAGITGKDLDGAARQVIEEAGYGKYFGHSFGHSVGVEIHENPGASPSNDKPLPAGTVVSAEPGIYLPGKFGVRIEDVIVITEDGCRDITNAPKDLLILQI